MLYGQSDVRIEVVFFFEHDAWLFYAFFSMVRNRSTLKAHRFFLTFRAVERPKPGPRAAAKMDSALPANAIGFLERNRTGSLELRNISNCMEQLFFFSKLSSHEKNLSQNFPEVFVCWVSAPGSATGRGLLQHALLHRKARLAVVASAFSDVSHLQCASGRRQSEKN